MTEFTPINDLLADHQMYHSTYQMDHQITAKSGGTIYGQYKQALRELFKRTRGLKELYTAKEMLHVDITEKEWQIETNLHKVGYQRTFDDSRNEVKVKKLRGDMDDLDHNIRDTEREFKRFYAQAIYFKSKVGELTPERRAELDSHMWAHYIKCSAALDYITLGRLSKPTVEQLQCTPIDQRTTLSEEIMPGKQSTQALTDWYLAYEPDDVPALEVDETLNVRGIIG